jgi:Sulfotransferase domain
MLVWVASYPRSGNALTMLTLQDVFGERRVGTITADDLRLGDMRDERLPGGRPWRPPPELRGLRGGELLDAIRARPEPFFIKTHRLSEASDPARALYIVRDGRDAVVSQAHFVKDHDVAAYRGLSFARRIATLTRPGMRPYGHWSRNVRRWTRRRAPVAVLRFEDLVRDPADAVAGACERIDVPVGDADGRMLPFESLHELVPALFRRGVVGAWEDEMPPHLEERFWRIHGEQMEALGYRRR